MRPARRTRLRTLCCALLAGAAVGSAGLPGPVAAAAGPAVPAPAASSSAASVEQRVARLQAQVADVGEELAADARAYEAAEDALTRLTLQTFAARVDSATLLDQETDARRALHGLARSAYKGGMPPMVTALLSGDPGAVSDLAYVQRSVNQLGAARGDATRELVLRQADAGEAVTRSADLRRQALAQRQALEGKKAELSARTAALTAELSEAGAALVQARAAEELAALERAASQRAASQAASSAAADEAARRAAVLTAEAAGVPYVPAGVGSTSGGDCQPPTGRAEANGFLSSTTLCPLATAPGHRLRTDAARAFDALNRARQAATGNVLCVTDSYRDYAGQVDVFRRKPGLAATPGRSQHGWGLAVDLCGGVQTFGGEAHRWMQANAPAFGWIHPSWARAGGSRPEAWHWEYVGGGASR